jgi:hypothetical protein
MKKGKDSPKKGKEIKLWKFVFMVEFKAAFWYNITVKQLCLKVKSKTKNKL